MERRFGTIKSITEQHIAHTIWAVLLFTTESQRGPVREALAAGASSIVSWLCPTRDLVLAVVNAARVTQGTGTPALLPEAESEIAAEAISTGKRNSLMEWTPRPDIQEVSTRLHGRGPAGRS